LKLLGKTVPRVLAMRIIEDTQSKGSGWRFLFASAEKSILVRVDYTT